MEKEEKMEEEDMKEKLKNTVIVSEKDDDVEIDFGERDNRSLFVMSERKEEESLKEKGTDDEDSEFDDYILIED